MEAIWYSRGRYWVLDVGHWIRIQDSEARETRKLIYLKGQDVDYGTRSSQSSERCVSRLLLAVRSLLVILAKIWWSGYPPEQYVGHSSLNTWNSYAGGEIPVYDSGGFEEDGLEQGPPGRKPNSANEGDGSWPHPGSSREKMKRQESKATADS